MAAEDVTPRQADAIRDFVIRTIIEPARASGTPQVLVRAGDIHQEMALTNAMPAVCSALGSKKFLGEAGVRLVDRDGPANSSTVTFTFGLHGRAIFTPAQAETELRRRYGDPTKDTDKMVGFALPDDREIALQRDVATVQLWVEDQQIAGSAPASGVRHYLPDQPRHSNLPPRLRHQATSGETPRRVATIGVRDFPTFAKILDWYDAGGDPLETMKRRFLARYPDFEEAGAFAATGGSYHADQRAQIDALLAEVGRSGGTAAGALDALVTASRAQARGANPPLLNGDEIWRVQKVREASFGAFDEALTELAAGVDPPEAIERFNQAFWPLLQALPDIRNPFRDTRTLPSTVLALLRPDSAIAVRYDPFQIAGRRLLDLSVFANAPMKASEYRTVLEIAERIRSVMRDDWNWAPRDLWDVHAFILSTCDRTASDPAKTNEQEALMAQAVSAPPTSLILYGPPGTGKTYATAVEAVRLCDGLSADDPLFEQAQRASLMARYRELVEAKRIGFVTFHQSYSYEDFVEGLRPETASSADEGESGGSAGFSLKPHPGIFRRIASAALSNRGRTPSAPTVDRTRKVFKMSLGRSGQEEGERLFRQAIEGSYVVLGYGGEIDWSGPEYDDYLAVRERWRQDQPTAHGNDPNIAQVYSLRGNMDVGSLVVISDGNSRFRAIGEVTGPYYFELGELREYNHRRPVRWLWSDPDGLSRELIYKRNFMMQSIYQLDSTQIDWPALEQIVASGGAVGGSAGTPEPYVLVIDEINRANVSKVFGELITLIEADKRLGAENELTVTLPYSGDPFGVPGNLHIVATMNTADRSIALLDTALRRRFRFKELMPRSDLLATDVEGINVRVLLGRLNERIEYLFDREHQIGHAYFIGCNTKAALDEAMRDKVIPLLTEYFYENWQRVWEVLGEADDGLGFLDRVRLNAVGDGENEPEAGRWRYTVRGEFDRLAYAQLSA